jgi:MoaA/NifB/PqqE/SkfB family radical SAM enzyme
MGTLYSNQKFLTHSGHLRALKEKRVVAPIHVRIKPINHCNHSCWYCAYRADQLQLGENMDLRDRLPEAKMFEVVDDLIDMGVKAVTFSGGGEPLIYKALPRVIERLAKGDVRIAALTNGSNLKGKMANAFADYATWVRVSIDAWDDESYSISRGVRDGEFSRVMENINEFARRGSDCVLGVSYIISKDNTEHIQDMCQRLRDAGINHVKLAAAVVSNDVAENNKYHRAIMDGVSRQIEHAMELSSPTFSVLNHYHETEERFTKDYHRCPFLMYLTVIGADANVYTCQDKAYNDTGCLGSIQNRSFKEFWFSEENRKALFGLDPNRDCAHHCVAHEKNLGILEHLSLDPAHADFV